MMNQVPINFAERATTHAIQAVADKTNAKHPGWVDECLGYLKIWLEHRHTEFQAEDFREHAQALLPPPSHARVYGSVMRAAQYRGWIQYVKTAPVKTIRNHRARASVWRSLLVKQIDG